MTGTAAAARWRFWAAAAVVFVLILWLLNDILLPFVVGMAVAYFLDPVVVRLQRVGLSRTWATTAVTILAILIAVPTAAVIGVVVRHLLGRYRESGIYRGGTPA